MKPWLFAVLVPLAGCSFYFGDDGDDCSNSGDDINYSGADVPVAGLRNPENGQCEYWGGGGGGGCGYPGYSDEAEAPDWATCYASCEGLDESTCLAATECRATYTGSTCPPGGDCLPPDNSFFECWGIAPSGPAGPEDCWSLDAYACSRHNDCSAVYNTDPATGVLSFTGCEPEAFQGCYSDEECPSGYECTADTMCLPPPGCGADGTDCDAPACYGQCVPSTSSCDIVDCGEGYHCEEQCYPCDVSDGEDCAPFCTPSCVPDYTTCDAVDCGPGYHCEDLCYPCDPLPDGTGCEDGPICEPSCVPDTTPTCDGVDCGPDAHCELQCYPPDPGDPSGPPDECYPVCEPDTGGTCDDIICEPESHCEETCVVSDCMPDGECPPPYCYGECVPDTDPISCEALATEDACVARPDCVPVYTGDDCTCYPWGCECAMLTYERCETGLIVDPMTGASSPAPRVVARTHRQAP